MYKCNFCNLVQLSKIPNLKDMYGSNYGYKTSVSNLMINHLKDKKNKFSKLNLFKKNSNILDIGSNDGTFLNFFLDLKKKLNLYGIDPSASAFLSNYKKEIKIIIDFFNKKTVTNLFLKKKIKFSLITSYAMFYDVEEPNEFSKAISNILEKDGIWAVEFSYFLYYLKILLRPNMPRTLYLLFFNDFQNIIKKNGLKIIDLELNEINGGSIEVLCSKKNSKFNEKTLLINKILKEEKKIGKKDFSKFNLRIENSKKNLQLFLVKLKSMKLLVMAHQQKAM